MNLRDKTEKTTFTKKIQTERGQPRNKCKGDRECPNPVDKMRIRFLKTLRVSNEDLFIESHSANHVRRSRELLAACESETNKYLPNVDEKR